jgi:hypothetical protein
MPLAAIGIGLGTAIAGGATAAGSLIGASKQASAAQNAAKLQTDASNQAAQLQAKAAAETLAFQKQQAAQDLATTNATQQANYNQWAAREGRLSNFQQALGMAPRNIPAYQPLPNSTAATLSSTQTAPNAGTLPTGQAPTGNLSDPNAWMSLVGNDQALKSWVAQGLGPASQTPGLVDYYVGKIKGQPGANPTEQAGSANYWMGKLQSDPNVTGKAAAPMAPANSMSAAMTTQPANPYTPMIAPALQLPNAANSFAAFLGR